MNSTTCLVTGGAGFIGSHLVDALRARNCQVRVLDNLATGKLGNLSPMDSIDFIEGDIRDLSICMRACQGVEFVFHQAALPSVPRSLADPLTSYEVCSTGTLNLLMAAREAGVQRFVYAGSSSAYGDTEVLPKVEEMPGRPRSPYAAAKLAGELHCRAFWHSYGLPTVVLRYFNIFGPRQDPNSPYSGVMAVFISRLLAGKSCTINGDGKTSRDFTYVKDAVAANLLAAESGAAAGGIYNVGSGRQTTLLELYATLAEIVTVHLPPQFGPERGGDVKHSLAGLENSARDLGYRPSCTLRQGLEETTEWYRREIQPAAVSA